jgi:hypothetical protein
MLRLKDSIDTAIPSMNGISVSNLFRLGALLGDKKYVTQAKDSVAVFEAEILQYPWLFPSLLSSVVAARLGTKVVVSPLKVQENTSQPSVTRTSYFNSPLGGLNSLVTWKSGESWLTQRNPLLGNVAGDAGGVFMFDGKTYTPVGDGVGEGDGI